MNARKRSAARIGAAIIVLTFAQSAPAEQPAAVADVIKELERRLSDLERQNAEQRRRIEDLESELRAVQTEREGQRGPGAESVTGPPGAPSPLEALDVAVSEIGSEEAAKPNAEQAPGGALWSSSLGPARLRLIDVSADLLVAAGGSSESDRELQVRQGGDHDPRKNGFTLQQVELSLAGAIDPFLRGEAHLIYFLDPIDGESEFELEEAFAYTQALPYGLQVEGGQFFTEFGRINPRHPHSWDWQDQPVIFSRLFGGDGMRGPGIRIGWLTPLPWFSELHYGVQNANGETMVSFLANEKVFEERPIGGRPFVDRDVDDLGDLVHLVRWDNGFDVRDDLGVKIGASLLVGPNAAGRDTDTWIYGVDLVAKWRTRGGRRGWPFVTFQAEAAGRSYETDAATIELADAPDVTTLPADTLHDWGAYAQLLWGFRLPWALGLRVDYADASGASFDASTGQRIARDVDPFRDQRWRFAPLLAYYPSEFSRLRLQYNLDIAEHLSADTSHAVWLGLEVLYGAHPAHAF